MSSVNLKDIDVGEPDANAEYHIALKRGKEPIYIQAYFDKHFSGMDELNEGTKFILFGQKGTGKTAILRRLEAISKKDYKTQYVVFKKEILEEAELARVSISDYESLIIDEEQIKNTKFFYHSMKRLFLTLLLSKCQDLESPPTNESWMLSLIDKIKDSGVGDIAISVTDSISSVLKSITVDIDKISGGKASLNASKAIKRSNDNYTKYCLSQIKRSSLKCRLFFDEMHFAYMDQSTLSADASLIRDTVLALCELNEKFIGEGIDVTIYMSIRSEFLQHHEIATADVAHSIQSYGKEIFWGNYSYNNDHPMFDMMISRLKLSIGDGITKSKMMDLFFPGNKGKIFLESTWGKPRDIVRFFKSAKESFPNKRSLSGKDYDTTIRKYVDFSWMEMKSTLTAFMPKESIPILENSLRTLATNTLDGTAKNNTKKEIIDILRPTHEHMLGLGIPYKIEEFFRLLYIIGVFYITYTDAKGQTILHQFHRGTKEPVDSGYVKMHFAIAKAFS